MANRIYAYNMTEFFTRGLKIYSFGDIQFKRPIALRQLLYGFLGVAVWSVPLILLLGFQFSPYFLFLTFGPPVFLGYYAIKPIYKGETLQELAKDVYVHLQEPKGWADFEPSNAKGTTEYYVEHEVWASRRRELQLLADIKERQNRGLDENPLEARRMTPA